MADMGGAFSSMGISVMNAIMNAGPDGFVENWFVVCGPDKGPCRGNSGNKSSKG